MNTSRGGHLRFTVAILQQNKYRFGTDLESSESDARKHACRMEKENVQLVQYSTSTVAPVGLRHPGPSVASPARRRTMNELNSRTWFGPDR